jgi:Mlc titration factor MtfA (ptsG expression regulator)
MVFSWLKRRRRNKLLAEPFPVEWLRYLHENVAYYDYLTEAEQAKLRDDLRVFIAEKHWEGCGGLRITDEIKVTIAAQACLLVLALEEDCYTRVKSILVYPRGYLGPSDRDGITGLIFEEERSGEAWYRGPVILSWTDALEEGRDPGLGKNLVFHEFAHQLDMLDGEVDGTPPLRDPQQAEEWREVMTAEYQRLVEESEQGEATLLDEYGATSEGEFFAVATECFFTRPVEMRRRHPRLYQVLREYYRQDPAARLANQPDGQSGEKE